MRPPLLPLALLLPLLWLFDAERALAASGASAAPAATPPSGLVAPAETELALCDSADFSNAGMSMSGISGASTADMTMGTSPPACRAPEKGEAPSAPEPAPADAAARAAPMCDNAAASVVAVPEVHEIDRGRFEPAPCDVQRLLARLRSDDRARGVHLIAGNDGERPEPQPIRLQPERFGAACAGGLYWPRPAEPSILALEGPPGLGWQRGHSARIERPPSAR